MPGPAIVGKRLQLAFFYKHHIVDYNERGIQMEYFCSVTYSSLNNLSTHIVKANSTNAILRSWKYYNKKEKKPFSFRR